MIASDNLLRHAPKGNGVAGASKTNFQRILAGGAGFLAAATFGFFNG